MKRIIALLSFPLALFSLAQEEEGTARTLTLEQEDGTVLELDSYPNRIVSLGPNITETIFALDRGDLLVGRTDYCDYPPQVGDVETVGNISEPSVEKIVQLSPDLVIASTHAQEAILKKIRSLGIPVLILYSEESFEGVYSLITQVGKALNNKEGAARIVDGMKGTVSRVMDEVADLPRPLVYYVVGYGEYGDYTAGGNTFIGQMIQMAGGENVARDLEGWRFSMEELIRRNPDLIICSQYWNAREGLMVAPGYRELDAVKQGRVYSIDNNMLDRQGPRLAQGLSELARIIHRGETDPK